MKDRIDVDPRIGDAIVTMIQRQCGQEVAIVLITISFGMSSVVPSFVSNLEPNNMDKFLVGIGEYIANGPGERTITGAINKGSVN